MERFRYLPGVVTLQLDVDKCIGCGECTLVCPQGVFEVSEKKARFIDRDGCMECGACAMNCPVQAISVNPGVGCAAYIVKSWIKGKDAASCDSTDCC